MPDPTNRGKPLTAGKLAAALAKFPPDTTVYMSFGGGADKPWRVAWGNEYNPGRQAGYLTIEGWEFGSDY